MGKTKINRQSHKKTNRTAPILAFLALVCAFLIAPSSTNTACAGAVTGCATDTWTAMVNQSILQTRREMVMNQRYIAKADSVLAYSCFEQMTSGIGAVMGVFSTTQRWENVEIDIIGDIAMVNVSLGADSLDAAIESAVLAPLATYLDTNFAHPWLGGLLSAGGADFSQSNHPCGTMREVWQMAKCMNATDDPLFYRFEDLIENDPRVYPANMTCENTGITQDQIDIARGSQTEFNDIIPHLAMVDPEQGCYRPIPTGVTVNRRSGAGRVTEEVTYEDALCMTAGCSYQNSGTAGLGTCEVRQ